MQPLCIRPTNGCLEVVCLIRWQVCTLVSCAKWHNCHTSIIEMWFIRFSLILTLHAWLRHKTLKLLFGIVLLCVWFKCSSSLVFWRNTLGFKPTVSIWGYKEHCHPFNSFKLLDQTFQCSCTVNPKVDISGKSDIKYMFLFAGGFECEVVTISKLRSLVYEERLGWVLIGFHLYQC